MTKFWRGFLVVAVMTLLTWSIALYFSVRNEVGLSLGDHLINAIVTGRNIFALVAIFGGSSLIYFFLSLFKGEEGIRFALGGFFGLSLLGLLYWLTWDLRERRAEIEENVWTIRLPFGEQ